MPEDKVIIFDTTLRDGEQAAGAAMTLDEKLEIARQLERLRVDVIEAGFAASSPGDFEAVRRKAAAITPVPGGVGPVTVASVVHNTVAAAERLARYIS